jgi:hypothetical protein
MFSPGDGTYLSRMNRNQEGITSLACANVIECRKMVSLTQRYDDRIAGVLSCYDRVVVTGTLPTVCYADGMTGFLSARGIRIFDYPAFASTLRDRVRERAVAAEAGSRSSAFPRVISVRKRSSPRCWNSAASTLVWYISSRRWRPARPTSPG